MLRFLLAVVAVHFLLLSLRAAEQQSPPPASPTSTIYFAQDSQSLEQFVENPAVTRRMVDRLVRTVTGQPDSARAWRSLVAPTDRVGIKISAAGGAYFASHRGIVNAIVDGLEQAGVPRARIIVWDREKDDLRDAGYTNQRGGFPVESIAPTTGYDRTAVFTAPVLGKLIWGDALFEEKQSKFGKRANEADQLSSNSHFANVLSRQITKIINVPVLSDHAGCGVGGAIYNVTIPNIDNWRRFTQSEGEASSGLADLYADEHIGPKVVLHIMDALLAQFAGGPHFNPNYAFAYHTIYASKDPVALDANALRLIEGWRKESKLPPIGKRAEWLESAEQMGLGHFAENKILLRAVGPE